MLIPL